MEIIYIYIYIEREREREREERYNRTTVLAIYKSIGTDGGGCS